MPERSFAGKWTPAADGGTLTRAQPSHREPLGSIVHAGHADLAAATASAAEAGMTPLNHLVLAPREVPFGSRKFVS